MKQLIHLFQNQFLNIVLSIVDTIAILLQPATNAVCCSKNIKVSNKLQCTALFAGCSRISVVWTSL